MDYYNRTVFEFVSTSFEAAQDSLGGGGRYDPLAELIGSTRAVPAVGVAMGCDRIVAAMGEAASARLDLYVAVADTARHETALRWVSELRRDGVRVDWDPNGGRSLKAQFKAANRLGAAAVAVVGDEWDAGEVTVKDLETSEERRIAVGEVTGWTSRH